ncbi:sugar kinase [Defluviimonas sp. WL0002]|uniref:Sugar kinase n=1 Tax=Albidovulum marisflavi TaxID=2984159 RepID=A0ABT2ZGQ0_9RHOB|nr:sugar kinase [Defluviimonas sp. WL0002]MCV2870317.1 sugar kinase [Defluviimonas sp. WL0002]
MRPRIAAIGEAMVEFAPVGDGLYRRNFAGDTFNTIWHMAQLLGDAARCGFVTRVGSDKLSDDFLSLLDADGLETSGVARDPARTMGLYLIELDGVERSFQYWRGESAARHLAEDTDSLSGAIAGTDCLYLSGVTLAILSPAGRANLFEVLAAARSGGARIVFDPNFRPRLWASRDQARGATRDMLTLTDIVLPSFDDERDLWNDTSPQATIDRYAGAGAAEVVVKNGGEGVFFASNGATGFIETPPATTILDTSGAGDSFNAGYLASRLRGGTPQDAVQAGHRLACVVIAHPGARAPKRAVRDFVESGAWKAVGAFI